MFGNYRRKGDFGKQFMKFQELTKIAKQYDNIAKRVLENITNSKIDYNFNSNRYIDDPIVAKSIIQINQELRDKLRKVFTESQRNAILNTMPAELQIKLHSQFRNKRFSTTKIFLPFLPLNFIAVLLIFLHS